MANPFPGGVFHRIGGLAAGRLFESGSGLKAKLDAGH
jgi:hypothetical protein